MDGGREPKRNTEDNQLTSYEFEVAAKNAVINVLREYDIDVSIEDLHLTWFVHLIGNKKCMVWGKPMGKMYAEITYSLESDVMYVDLYEKKDHRELHAYELDTTVHI